MTVLITAASKHGSTAGIARAIAGELQSLGIASDLREPDDVADAAGYDAFVIGSAIYMGRWQDAARDFVRDNAELLRRRPVWLFSSGPVGDNEQVGIDPKALDDLTATCAPREHRLFAGRLDRTTLGRAERLITRVVKAPEGDYRDWDAIRAWADEIGASLQAVGIEA